MKLTLSNGTVIEFSPGYPEEFRGPVLQGSKAFFSTTDLAQIVIQELESDLYSIRLVVGKIVQKIYSKGWIHSEGLYSYFVLKNGTRKRINTVGNLHIRQDQYACFFTESSDCSAVFEKTNEFRALDLFYSPKLL